MLQEAGRALQKEVDRQMDLWGTEGWTTASSSNADKDTDSAVDNVIKNPEIIIDMDDPDAVMAQFMAKQNAKQLAHASLPVKMWARNIACMAKTEQQQNRNRQQQQQPQSTLTGTNTPKEKEQGKKELVSYLCLKFLEYQQL
jgi:hypothetical protein